MNQPKMNKGLPKIIERENLAKLLGIQSEKINELSSDSIYQLLWIKYFGSVKVQSKDNSITENLFLSTMMNKILRKGVPQDARNK